MKPVFVATSKEAYTYFVKTAIVHILIIILKFSCLTFWLTSHVYFTLINDSETNRQIT